MACASALSRQLSTSREGARQIRFMLLLRHLATASPLRLGRSAALTVECVVDGGVDTEEALRGSS